MLERDDPFTEVSVASAADVVLSKLRWYRAGGEQSDRQWRDILGVLRAQRGQLDFDYLRRWAADQHTLDLLERAEATSN